MRRVSLICCLTATVFVVHAANLPSGAEIADMLQQLSIDAGQTYRVHELHLSRGGASIYLTDGTLAFATPVCGRTVAAIFTTQGSDTGDAELLLMPPRASERASLASFAKTPNLDEHFTSALFLFSDDTARELKAQIENGFVEKSPAAAAGMAQNANPLLRAASAQLATQIVDALLGGGKPEEGFFYAAVLGRTVGPFDFLYQPQEFEPVTLGRAVASAAYSPFELWTAFRPRNAPVYHAPAAAITDYQIDATIHDDLSISVEARMKLAAPPESGRVLQFDISDRLKVASAAVDGKPVEVFQRPEVRTSVLGGEGAFLLIAGAPFPPGSTHTVTVKYAGSIIREMADGTYAVTDRDAWYPSMSPTFANFDLTFRCPPRLDLVSTGGLIGDQVLNSERIVHRKTLVPEHVAGFNLGDYKVAAADHGLYHIECYTNAGAEPAQPQPRNASGTLPDASTTLIRQTENILDDYTRRWGPLPIHSIAISPVPGYFGQGFPGLIYLSDISYLPVDKRPLIARGPRQDTFFSDLLLPHEVSHQWWGNIVRAADYRTAWLIEAMAEDSAMQYVESTKGVDAVNAELDRYRADLAKTENGSPIKAAGPLDFGVRLMNTAGFSVWETITYEKGAWVLHMLRQRLGNDGFHKLQLAMLAQYRAKPITNEDFRRLASEFVPADADDRSLTDFFDAWIYGTGIPALHLEGSGRNASVDVSGVDDAFTVDIPLSCKSRQGAGKTRWVRASSGSNPLNLPLGESCGLPSPDAFLYSQ